MRIQITRSQYAIRKQTEAEEIYKKLIIRIANKRRSKATIIQSSSDEEEDSIVMEFSDDEILGASEEAEVEIEIKKRKFQLQGVFSELLALESFLKGLETEFYARRASAM